MDWPRLHILVTRPQQQAQGLIKALDAKGASVLLFPTLHIKPVDHAQTLRQELKHIQDYDWLFFISPNAVEHGVPLILKNHAIHDLNCQWAAVGAGTKDVLQAYGARDVNYPLDGIGALALLDSLRNYDFANKKCMVFKGDSGNEELETGLRERGALVTDLVCYQRLRTQDNPKPLASALSEERVDLIVITSGDALKALHSLLPKSVEQQLLNITLLVISERIEKIAQSLGFQRIIRAVDASDDAITACIDAWVQTRSDDDTKQ
jgi:uroporphyrinogen-III synthase